MIDAAKPLEIDDAAAALERATDEAIFACDGDAWATVRVLLVANTALEDEVRRLKARAARRYGRRLRSSDRR